MPPYQYRLFMLSPYMISLGVAAMRVCPPDPDKAPLHRYIGEKDKAEKAVNA